MIIDKKSKNVEVQTTGTFESQEASISQEDMHKLWDMLQNPYKNSIGAVVREYVSNCFDSHAEAGIDDAVSVTIAKDDGGWYWACEDFGVGLSPQRMTDVFCNYLKSTKENTNNQIGAFGIGSKSGLAYTDIVHIRTRFDGVEYTYLLRKGERVPSLDKVFETPTTERNGTQIKIYILDEHNQGSYSPEVSKFKKECSRQLAYFDNVYYTGCDINNDYKIVVGENWVAKKTSPFTDLHICLGKVAYPIDWANLGIDRIDCPVALKFDIGDLDIIQTREDVKYTNKTKTAILEKIDSFKKEFIDWWNDNNFNTDDLEKYVEFSISSKYFYTIEEGEFKFSINLYNIFRQSCSSLLKRLQYAPAMKDNFLGVIPSAPLFEYEIINKLNKSGRLSKVGYWDARSNTGVLGVIKKLENKVYRLRGKTNTKTNLYILNKYEDSKNILFIKPKSGVTLKDYIYQLGLHKVPKSEWRKQIKWYQDTIRKYVIDNTISYSEETPTKEFLDSLQADAKVRTVGEISTTKFGHWGWYSYVNFSDLQWNRYSYKLEDLDDPTNCLIYGVKEDKDFLEFASTLFSNGFNIPNGELFAHNSQSRYNTKPLRNKLRVIYVSKANKDLLDDCKLENSWTVDKIFNKNCRKFVECMTMYHINKLKKYDDVLKLNADCWETINIKIANIISKYKSLRNKYHDSIYYDHYFVNSIAYPMALEKDMIDYSMIDELEEVNKYFENLELLKFVDDSSVEIFPTIEVAKYIYMYNKSVKDPKRFKKLNIHFYINFNEEEIKWLQSNEEESKFVNYRLETA